MDQIERVFRPEFLNRIDDVIVFHQLTREQIIHIVDLMIANLDERLKAKDMGIELTQAAKDLLAARGYDPLLGARPLRRLLVNAVEDELSEGILSGKFPIASTVTVTTDEDGKNLLLLNEDGETLETAEPEGTTA